MSNFNSKIEDGIFESMDIPFAQVSKYALGDLSMSNKAKGLYAIIAMYITTPNYPLRKKTLMDMSTDGIRAFNSEWAELKEKGYLKQMRIRVEKGFTYKYRLCIKPDLETPATVNVQMDGTIVDNTYEGQETFDDILPDNTPCLDIEVEDEYEIKSQINYSKLKYEPFIDEIVDTILEINESEEIIMSVNGEHLPTHKLKTAFKKLDSRMIKEVIERLKTYNKPIINIKSFLITVLYNAVPQDYSTGTDPP